MDMKVVDVRLGAVFLALSCSQPLLSATVDTSASDRITIDVPSGEDYTLSSSDVAALGTGLAMYKTGAGRLIISTDLKEAGWDGEIVVSAGYLRTTLNGALGGVGKGTAIVPGATLEIEDNSASYANIHPKEKFSIGGTGVGGYGAVYATKSGKSISPNMMFGGAYVTLTADTTVGYSGSGGFRGSCGFRGTTIDMAGYTLTFTKGEGHGFFGGSISNPGRIEVEAGRSLTLENNIDLGDKPDKTLWLGEGAFLYLQNMAGYSYNYKCSGWKLETEGDATLTVQNADPSSWYGPIHLGGTLTLKGSTKTGTFRGAISGPGSIVVQSGIDHFTNKTDEVNTFTGKFTVSGGKAYLTGLRSIPSLTEGGVSGTRGLLSLSAVESDTITDDILYDIWHGVTTNSTQPASQAPDSYNGSVQRSDLFDFMLGLGRDYVFSKTIADPLTVYHGGADETLTVESEMTALPNFLNYAGTTKFAGEGVKNASWVDVRGGTVEVAAGAELNLYSNAYVCAAYPDVARLKIAGTYGHAAGACGTKVGRNLASAHDCGRGVMEILDGAVVEESFPNYSSSAASSFVPNGWGNCERLEDSHPLSVASYYQRGGVFRTVSGKENFIGNWLSAYYSLEGGLLHLRSSSRLARFSKATVVIHQRGGVCLADNAGFNCACAGRPVWHYISGGTFVGSNMTYVAVRPDYEGQYRTQGYNALSVLTVDGPGSLCEFFVSTGNRPWLTTLSLAAQHRSRGQLNLLSGGTMRGNCVNKPLSSDVNGSTVALEGNVADVAFDGGVFEATHQMTGRTNPTHIFRNFSGPDDHVKVFAGGATIVTADGKDWTIGAALEAPEGNGVESVPLPDGILNADPWEFTAAPTVEIVDPSGVGTGATAVAVFDTVAGKVTGIKVTNRGNNYTAANAFISRGGHTNSWTVAATVSENASGGFTKDGSGTLTVDHVCSYTGLTTVAGGTLKLGVDGAIDASSGIVLAGGTLDVDSKTFDVPVVGGAGTITGTDAVSMSGNMVFDAAKVLAKETLSFGGEIAFPSDAMVGISDHSGSLQTKRGRFLLITAEGGFTGSLPALSEELALDGWSLVLSPDGKNLYLYRSKGLRLYFR